MRSANVDGGLVARGRELANIDRNLQQASLGRASAIELRGLAGVGKSALIEIAIARASRFRTVVIRGDRATGRPVLRPEWPEPLKDLVNRLQDDDPGSQAAGATNPQASAAVAAALGELVGHDQIPVLLTVDEAQYLPVAFVNAIAEVVCTRLQDQPVSLIVARTDAPNLGPLPAIPWPTTHTLSGLNAVQTETLLSARLGLEPHEQVVAELVGGTSGNPLALLEVCSRLDSGQLAGWQPLPDPLPVGAAVIEAYDLAADLPDKTRASLVVRAVTRAPNDRLGPLLASLGLEDEDLIPAIEAGIVAPNGTRIDFCHPLVRAAIFNGAAADHRELARTALNAELERNATFESRAYFAVAGAGAPDELAAGRFAESARLALERGDPAGAAQSEEQAARFAASDNAAVSHLAAAAAAWRAAGVQERARHCIETASELTAGDAARGQLAYQQAWLHQDQGEAAVAEHLLRAAELSATEAPYRAVAMLIDAAAWKILGNDQADAERIADRAVSLAATVSSYLANLAEAVRIATVAARGGDTDPARAGAVLDALMAQSDSFRQAPETALVIGQTLQRRGMRSESDRWIEWLGRCAERDGNVQLRLVARLLSAFSETTALNVPAASAAIEHLLRDIDAADGAAVIAWVWAIAVTLRAVTGQHERGFADSVNLLALPPAVGAVPRLLATASFASLDLQRGRIGAARAWIATTVEELDRTVATTTTGERYLSAPLAGLAPLASTVALLSARYVDRSAEPLLVPSASDSWRTWITAVYETDPDVALRGFAEVRERSGNVHLALAHLDICVAIKLLAAGRREEGRRLLEEISAAANRAGASGLAGLATAQLELLETNDAAGAVIGAAPPMMGASAAVDAAPAAASLSTPAAAWEINLLGEFTVRSAGQVVNLPPSLATEAIKIVALQGKIILDQLVELLWEDASPGVGVRRLRNVLWRIRSSCGDVVVRDGQYLRLAHDAVTDVGRFEALAAQALDRDVPLAAAAVAAREALQLYRGELLPANRYDDWTTRARELASRTKVSLLELLIDDALDNERTGEALTLLDRLAQEDPNDEAPLVRIAELHLLSGNRSRALESLDRAEAILRDLGIGTTPAITRLREGLSRRPV